MRKQFSATFKAQVVQELLKEEKSIAQLAAEYGVHPTQLGKWKALALHGLPSLFEERAEVEALKTAHEAQLTALYAEIGRLTTQVAWLKKNLACHLDRAERLALVERGRSKLPLTVQADLLSLSRASLYYRPRTPSLEEVAIKHRIDALYTQYPFYGSRRIAAQLRRDGLLVNRKAVQRHMREMGIAGVAPGANLSRRDSEHRVYPYLLRDLTSAYPNHVWGIDITYVRLHAGWLYLVAVLDWFSRYVISWELDQTLALPFVLVAVQRALAQAQPVIWNSDQGSHFTSPQYLELLTTAGVHISMDGKGRALDNIFVERLWRTVKYEEVFLHDYASPREARQGLRAYFMFYNEERPHQALGYRTPAETYFAPIP
jgi:putative transposase